MKPKWRRSEKLLFVAPVALVAFFYYQARMARVVFRHPQYLLSLAFSPDGKSLATGCGDNQVRFWDVETGALEKTLEVPVDNVTSVAYSADGRLFAVAAGAYGPSHLLVWDRRSGSQLWTLPGNTSESGRIVFSPDGRLLASGGSGLKVWDMQTGRLLKTLGGTEYGAPYGIWSVAFSPDGRTLATTGYLDHSVKLWNVGTGKLMKTMVYAKAWARSVAFSPDGHIVAAGGDDGNLTGPVPWKIKLWDTRTGQLLRTIEAHGNNIRSVVFSPSGRTLASGGYDHTVKVWDSATFALKQTETTHDGVCCVAYSPDESLLAYGADDGRVVKVSLKPGS